MTKTMVFELDTALNGIYENLNPDERNIWQKYQSCKDDLLLNLEARLLVTAWQGKPPTWKVAADLQGEFAPHPERGWDLRHHHKDCAHLEDLIVEEALRRAYRKAQAEQDGPKPWHAHIRTDREIEAMIRADQNAGKSAGADRIAERYNLPRARVRAVAKRIEQDPEMKKIRDGGRPKKSKH